MKFTTKIGDTSFIVRRFHGTETLADGYDFELYLHAKGVEQNYVGQRVVVQIEDAKLSGVVYQWRVLYQDLEENIHIYARFTSSFQYYSQYKTCKIHKNQDLHGVVSRVLRANNVQYKFLDNAKKHYDTLVQYNESNLNLVRHITSYNTVYYFFEHTHDVDTIVFANNNSSMSGNTNLTFTNRQQSIDLKRHDFVHNWEVQYNFGPKHSVISWFNKDNPEQRKPGMANHSQNQYGCEEIYNTSPQSHQEGNLLAQNIIENPDSQIHYLTKTKNPTIRAGNRVQLVNSEGFDGEYYSFQITHHYDGDIYYNECRFIDFKTKFYPKIIDLQGISGLQTGTVVGGEGLEVDQKDGHVKVSFHWDKDEWMYVPVLQSVAGNGFGSFALPRIGQRVAVMFEDSDPNRPFICGAFYDGSHQIPYENECHSGYKSKSFHQKKYNEIRFDDSTGQEKIILSACKDVLEDIYDNKHTTVHTGSMQVKIEEGNYNLELSGAKNTKHQIKISNGDCKTEVVNGSHEINIGQGNLEVQIRNGDVKYRIENGQFIIDVPTIVINAQEATVNAGKVNFVSDSIDMNASETVNISGGAIVIKSNTELDISSSTNITVRSGKINLN